MKQPIEYVKDTQRYAQKKFNWLFEIQPLVWFIFWVVFLLMFFRFRSTDALVISFIILIYWRTKK